MKDRLEVEIKAYCDDLTKIKRRITTIGGIYSKTVKEKDIYFSHPFRDFASTDEALRIRISEGKNILTYKGPKLSEKTKTRYEQETEFENYNNMFEILLKLGFSVVEKVIKTREIYQIKDIKISLDDVEGVGKFVELEKIHKDKDLIEKELFSIAGELELNEFERKSYLELLLEKKKQK